MYLAVKYYYTNWTFSEYKVRCKSCSYTSACLYKLEFIVYLQCQHVIIKRLNTLHSQPDAKIVNILQQTHLMGGVSGEKHAGQERYCSGILC